MHARIDRCDDTALPALLAETSTDDLLDDLRSLEESALDAWLADPEVAYAVAAALLPRVPQVLAADERPMPHATVCLEVRGSDLAQTIELGGGGAARQVAIGADAATLVRLLCGRADAALLHLAGDLDVRGDARLALEVGAALQVPGEGHAAVDPTALDPVDVATACDRASDDHLRAVMSGGFREIVLGEVFRRLPDFLDAHRARRTTVSVAFEVGGRADGGTDHHLVRVDRGEVHVERRDAVPTADATLVLDGLAFLRLVTGRLHPVRGVLSGGLRVRGDRGAALTFNRLMTPPRPRGR